MLTLYAGCGNRHQPDAWITPVDEGVGAGISIYFLYTRLALLYTFFKSG
ncbi:hypothetical protein DN37_2672 [Vibrio cholerae]|nr:hypothetical protein DN37_2672 [Vibrio cholerae]